MHKLKTYYINTSEGMNPSRSLHIV